MVKSEEKNKFPWLLLSRAFLRAYDVNTVATPDLSVVVLVYLGTFGFWRLQPLVTVSLLSN